MVPGTRACQLVSSYPQSAANYLLVIAAMKDRLGDKVLLMEVLIYLLRLRPIAVFSNCLIEWPIVV